MVAGVAVAAVAGAFALAGPASAEIATTHCGAPISSATKTMVNNDFSIPNGTFVNVPNAAFVVVVPTGQTRCVKLRFSVVSSCATVSANQHCIVRVRDDAAAFPFDPAVVIDSNEPTLAAHGFEWATRLSAGSHTLRVQAAGNPGGPLVIANWTFAMELAK